MSQSVPFPSMRRLSLLLLLVLVAACGGGDDEPAELSRSEYTKQANAICVDVEKKLALLGGFENFKELSREMLEGQEALQKSADDLAALRPPVALRANHQKLVDLQEETADLAGQMSIAAGENDQVEMQTQAQRADQLTVSANEVSRKLGVEECVAG